MRRSYEVPYELSEEQKQKGREAAVIARKERAAFGELMKRGDVPASKALYMEQAQGMRIGAFLGHCPGVGPATREKCLRDLGISYKHRVGGLGVRQKVHLQQWLEDNVDHVVHQ